MPTISEVLGWRPDLTGTAPAARCSSATSSRPAVASLLTRGTASGLFRGSPRRARSRRDRSRFRRSRFRAAAYSASRADLGSMNRSPTAGAYDSDRAEMRSTAGSWRSPPPFRAVGLASDLQLEAKPFRRDVADPQSPRKLSFRARSSHSRRQPSGPRSYSRLHWGQTGKRSGSRDGTHTLPHSAMTVVPLRSASVSFPFST